MRIRAAVALVAALTLLLVAGCAPQSPPAQAPAGGGQQAAQPSQPAQQAPAKPFYEGKTLQIIVAYEAGGVQDLEARAIAEFLADHIPGKPQIQVRNMPGAGGLQAVKYVYDGVKADGLTIGFFGASPPTEQLLSTDAAAVDFDLNQMAWLGSTGGTARIFVVRNDAPYQTAEELMNGTTPLKAGATRPGSTTFTGPALMKAALGAPIDIITGYSGGSDRDLAFFRGEVHGLYGSWSTFVTRNVDWLESGLAVPMLLFEKRVPDAELQQYFGHTNVPHILDLVNDPDDLALLRLATYPGQWGRLLGAPPGTPDEAVAALRQAVDALRTDESFKATLKERKLDIDLVPGAEVQQMIKDYLASDNAVVERYNAVIEGS